jgi:predicted DNA-binding transcriptional regulator AlpA
VLETEKASRHVSRDRLLNAKEIAARLGYAMATVTRAWKSGRYPFMMKDGGRLVGSEDGMERWIKNRTTGRLIR